MLAASAPAQALPITYEMVALTGMAAPGAANGQVFSNFNTNAPVLNDLGQVAFIGTLTGSGIDGTNNVGIWSQGSGNLALVTRAGDQAPGAAAGQVFNTNFNAVALNNQGKAAFFGRLTGAGVDGTNDVGMWSGSTGSLAVIAREGSAAPGTGAGQVFENFGGLSSPLLNNQGQTAFIGSVTGPGVDASNNSAIWSEGGGSLALAAREGSQAPGAPAGQTFAAFNSFDFNDQGKTSFAGTLAGAGVTTANDIGIWSGGTGSLAVVAREGDQAPATPAGQVFTQLLNPEINNQGNVIFFGRVDGGGATTANDVGIWSDGSGALALVSRESDQAPGAPAGQTFSAYGIPVLNDLGEAAFVGRLAVGVAGVTADNNSGIWSNSSGSLSLVAREGSQAPGAAAGQVFAEINSTPVLNDDGRIAFSGVLVGAGIDSTNDRGLWMTDALGMLTLIVREGDMFDIGGGVLRTIQSIGVNEGVAASRSGLNPLNDDGTLVFRLAFTDGSQGIFTADIAEPQTATLPEPGALALLALGLAGMAVARRRSSAAPV